MSNDVICCLKPKSAYMSLSVLTASFPPSTAASIAVERVANWYEWYALVDSTSAAAFLLWTISARSAVSAGVVLSLVLLLLLLLPSEVKNLFMSSDCWSFSSVGRNV